MVIRKGRASRLVVSTGRPSKSWAIKVQEEDDGEDDTNQRNEGREEVKERELMYLTIDGYGGKCRSETTGLPLARVLVQ